MSSLLERLEHALVNCADTELAAELRAERACYLARIGRFSEVLEELVQLRSQFGNGRNPRMSIWIMLVEGLLSYFEKMDDSARDRLLRAKAIADALQVEDLSDLTTAWLAHVEFNRSNYEAMLFCLQRWAGRVDGLRGAVGTRVTLLLADAFAYGGDLTLARAWYERSRQLAIDEGDQATIAAIVYNKAALGLNRIRIQALEDEVASDVVEFSSREVSSAKNYHDAVGHTELQRLLDACRARILILQGEYADAKLIFQRLLLDEGERFSLSMDQLILQLEYCLCLLALNDKTECIRRLLLIDATIYKSLAPDDRYLFLASYKRVVDLSGHASAVDDLGALINDAKGQMQMTLRRLLLGLKQIIILLD